MFLHNDLELFREVIYSAATDLNLPIPVVEKDYYVTMLLKQLAEKAPACVFKGGTSLSKCHHAIDRFSEDIDIAFTDKLTTGERKRLKDITIAGISAELALPIVDWEKARSRRNYNCYTFSYQPLEDILPDSLIQGVKMEIVLGSTSFPTVQMPVDSYVYQYLSKENMDIVEEYDLKPFEMKLQSLERTLVDKVFALCDYYLTEKIHRNSRHIYDIYMLLPLVKQDETFKKLVHEVRLVRSKMEICPSAKEGIKIPKLLREIIAEKVYQSDYNLITTYFQQHPVAYEEAVIALEKIAESSIFEDETFNLI